MAKYLEEKTGGKIYYGSDSGDELYRYTIEDREKDFAHFIRVGNKPYRGSRFSMNKEKYERHCDFCDKPMVRYGFGGGYAGFSCHGCGKIEETRDGGKTWKNITNNKE